MNITSIKQYSVDIQNLAKEAYSLLLADIKAELEALNYSRKQPPFPVHYAWETEPANTSNPSEKDVITTVHLIARIEGELAVQASRVRSGMYTPDFNARVRLMFAMRSEYAILDQQTRMMPDGKSGMGAQTVDQASNAIIDKMNKIGSKVGANV